MSDEERLNALVLELRTLEGYLNEVREREALVSKAFLDTKAAMDALNALPKDGNAEVIIPIGGGLLITSQTPPPEKVLVSVGANVVVEKSRADAMTFVEERIKELEQAMTSLAAQRNGLINKISGTRAELGGLMGRLQGERQGG